jgi:antitoxin HicB
MRTNSTTTKHTYSAVFDLAEEGGFIVTFPALPGVVTEGDTPKQGLTMAAHAMRGYLESLAKDGLPAPAEGPPARAPLTRGTVAVTV